MRSANVRPHLCLSRTKRKQKPPVLFGLSLSALYRTSTGQIMLWPLYSHIPIPTWEGGMWEPGRRFKREWLLVASRAFCTHSSSVFFAVFIASAALLSDFRPHSFQLQPSIRLRCKTLCDATMEAMKKTNQMEFIHGRIGRFLRFSSKVFPVLMFVSRKTHRY